MNILNTIMLLILLTGISLLVTYFILSWVASKQLDAEMNKPDTCIPNTNLSNLKDDSSIERIKLEKIVRFDDDLNSYQVKDVDSVEQIDNDLIKELNNKYPAETIRPIDASA